MAKAKKLPSGSWNIRAFSHKDENGKAIYISFTHPDKDECRWQYEQWFRNRKKNPRSVLGMTVREAVKKYIAMSEDILSPTTLQSYYHTERYGFSDLMEMQIDRLTDEIVQAEINKESKRKATKKNAIISPKTVKNEWTLISAALNQQGYKFKVRLPKRQRRIEALPEPEQVMSAIHGTSVELPCLLAMWMSLRLSEIRGLTPEAIHGDMLYVTQVKIHVGGQDIVKQSAKTSSSIRCIKIPPYILRMINETPAMKEYARTGAVGFIVDMPESTLRHTVTRIMKQNGMDLSIHDLRHIFASVSLVKLGIDSRTVQMTGGWSSPTIMMEVYNNGFNEDQQKAFDKRNAYYDRIITSCETQM